MELKVASLHFYPIKSCAATDVETLEFGPRGPLYDREWMLIDAATSTFLTQRQQTSLARVKTNLKSSTLEISIPEQSEKLELPLQGSSGPQIVTKVWKDECLVYEPSTKVSEGFSEYLKHKVKLVPMQPDFTRLLDEKYKVPRAQTGFTDQFPVLLTSLASLAELNARLNERVPMNRFRANIVLEGGEAFAEDRWQTVKIGAIEFKVSKPCARCIVINTDQKTGERAPEPLKTLATFRRSDAGKVLFGQYLIHLQEGRIRKTDVVRVEE